VRGEAAGRQGLTLGPVMAQLETHLGVALGQIEWLRDETAQVEPPRVTASARPCLETGRARQAAGEERGG
jgi:hypothetical protein